MERSELEMISTPFEDKRYYENIRRALCSGFFMQVAKKEPQGKSMYLTIKDHQNVLLHPSTVLGCDAEWVLYNDSCSPLRTTSEPSPLSNQSGFCYYDLSTFAKGDIRTALLRAADRLERKERLRADPGKRRV
ncbi:factor ATP-dependent RNA helicase [Aspergillus sclerotialis]|uniref:Factor ATP-dependent RNA helicase n=1 Tax=Aspergillus sclerotialis TaxID=2070753 RepID=A0A3A2Z2S4_9EURO|nr:factor ATP-dependent RNA helicase [Aspergillus sclerotialis]